MEEQNNRVSLEVAATLEVAREILRQVKSRELLFIPPV